MLGVEKRLDIFGTVCRAELLVQYSVSLCLVLHTVCVHLPIPPFSILSPFIMLHMGDIGLNGCGLLNAPAASACELTGNTV